jgi:hypothetical protein
MATRIICLVISLYCIPMLAGCRTLAAWDQSPEPLFSEAPLPRLFPMTQQEKIQAVHHWELIAKHTASLIKETLQNGYPRRVKAIYVAPSGITPFEKVFHALLITQLFEEGLSVVNAPGDNLILSFDIELVKHPARVISIDSAFYASLGPGLVVKAGPSASQARKAADRDYLVSKTTHMSSDTENHVFTLPENEIVLTTSLTQNGSYIVRNSSVYYIDDPEWWQYVQKADITYPSQTNYLLTDR